MTLVKIENVGGMWLREKRLAKKWSQETLAERSGACTKSFISQIENNKYPNKDGSPMQPSLSTVDAWAEALGESCNEARKLFNYPETDSELMPDEVLAEFTYAIGRYKQLSKPMQKYFGTHVNEFLDLLINIDSAHTQEINVPPNHSTGDVSAASQTVHHAKTSELPEISVEDATELSKRKTKGAKTAKGPSKNSPD